MNFPTSFPDRKWSNERKKWNSWSTKRKNRIEGSSGAEDEIHRRVFSHRSGREIRNKRSADLRKFIHLGRSKLTEEQEQGDRERRESAVKRSMVSPRVTLCETQATVIRLYSPFRIQWYSREGRETGSKILVSCPHSPVSFLCASVPFDYSSSNIQRNGDRFCAEFAESMEPSYLRWYILHPWIEEVMNKEDRLTERDV